MSKPCKYCEQEFDWAWDENAKRWAPLVPLNQTEGLTRDFVDADGNLRASHRQVCTENKGGALRVTKLDKPIPAEIADNYGEVIAHNRKPAAVKRSRRKKSEPVQEQMQV